MGITDAIISSYTTPHPSSSSNMSYSMMIPFLVFTVLLMFVARFLNSITDGKTDNRLSVFVAAVGVASGFVLNDLGSLFISVVLITLAYFVATTPKGFYFGIHPREKPIRPNAISLVFVTGYVLFALLTEYVYDNIGPSSLSGFLSLGVSSVIYFATARTLNYANAEVDAIYAFTSAGAENIRNHLIFLSIAGIVLSAAIYPSAHGDALFIAVFSVILIFVALSAPEELLGFLSISSLMVLSMTIATGLISKFQYDSLFESFGAEMALLSFIVFLIGTVFPFFVLMYDKDLTRFENHGC